MELNSKSITQVALHEKPQERQDIHHHHQDGKGEVSCGACKKWEKIDSEKGKVLNKLSGPKDYNWLQWAFSITDVSRTILREGLVCLS